MRTGLAVAILLALLAFAVGIALWSWRQIGDVPISGHGLVALGLGVGLAFLLGVGLMSLVFFSNRRGYDDRANQADPTNPAARRFRQRRGADADRGSS